MLRKKKKKDFIKTLTEILILATLGQLPPVSAQTVAWLLTNNKQNNKNGKPLAASLEAKPDAVTVLFSPVNNLDSV